MASARDIWLNGNHFMLCLSGIALGYRLDDRWGGGVRVPAEAGNFSLNHRIHTASGTHPASYPVGSRGSFPGGKAVGAWSWPLTSSAEVECVEVYLSSPSTLSWRGVQLKQRNYFTLYPLPFNRSFHTCSAYSFTISVRCNCSRNSSSSSLIFVHFPTAAFPTKTDGPCRKHRFAGHIFQIEMFFEPVFAVSSISSNYNAVFCARKAGGTKKWMQNNNKRNVRTKEEPSEE
jgi:hypothetical protein